MDIVLEVGCRGCWDYHIHHLFPSVLHSARESGVAFPPWWHFCQQVGGSSPFLHLRIQDFKMIENIKSIQNILRPKSCPRRSGAQAWGSRIEWEGDDDVAKDTKNIKNIRNIQNIKNTLRLTPRLG